MKKKQFLIWLDRETLSLLKAEADYRGVNPEDLAGQVVREYLERQDKELQERG